MKILRILISLLIFLFLSCTLSNVLSSPLSQSNLNNQCLDDQRSTLLQLQQALYYAPNFTHSFQVQLWDLNNTDCCSWEGVTCDAVGHVTRIDLSYKNLYGSFHSIFNLHHLQHLNLAGNNFNRNPFSFGFGKLPNLTHLKLSNSCFYGQIPVEISHLTRLVSLDFSYQRSCIWRNDPSFDSDDYFYHILKLENLRSLIKNLRSLEELYLDGVNISNQTDKCVWCETISLALPNLRVLSMSDCGLKGALCSSLLRLPFLYKLNLDFNSFSYLLPNFSKISSPLVSLFLVNCNLNGHFPTEILLLPKLQSIDISYNENLMGQLPEFSINSTLRSLSLSHTNFSGNLPESIGNLKFLTDLTLRGCQFSGSIPSSITNLTNLVQLDLSFNNFSGSIPPFHRSGVSNLAHLYLDDNKLSGSIHSSLFTLPSLRTLFLRYNQLAGEIDEFVNASSSLIEVLDLSFNNLRGSIPNSILHLSRLEWLGIGYNSFGSMKIDMFFQLNKLIGLHLSNISLLVGSYNKRVAFPQLEVLYLRSCNLTEFPEFIKTQDNLVDLDLSFNAIHFPKRISSFPMLGMLRLKSCNISSFPSFLKSQEKLEWLDLSNNNINGAIPNWVWKKSLQNLYLSNNYLSSLDQFLPNQSLSSSQASLQSPICNLSQLQSFKASYNKLAGPIPSCFGNITTLKSLDLQQNNLNGNLPDFARASLLSTLQLSDNKLEGKLPRSLANCTMLQILNLGNNTLSDAFPLWLGELSRLMVLILRGNRFFGPVKIVKNTFPLLDVLDIASNNFSGQLSVEFFQGRQLRSLKVSGNRLNGRLPRSLASFTKLEVVDLGKNMIHNTFPFWLEKLPSLKVLVLRGNQFYGTIKFSEGLGDYVFPMLRILDLASNNFSGELSVAFLQSFRAMMMITTDEKKAKPNYIGDDYYQDSVTIVNKGSEMFYQKILTIFVCLDLSNNSFHGIIPEEIGNLTSLIVLNLSHNSFSSQIPWAIENLKELESLDLSQNKLSGKIPLQLASLTFLAVLNLSYNQLEGSIPQGNQFDIFSTDSYRGNPRLCGPPLTRRCSEVGTTGKPPPKKNDTADSFLDGFSDWKIILIGYGCGLVIGLCIGYTVLNEMGNKWLHSYKRYKERKLRRSRG